MATSFVLRKKKTNGKNYADRNSIISYDNVNAPKLAKKVTQSGGKNEKLGLEGFHGQSTKENEIEKNGENLSAKKHKSVDNIGGADTQNSSGSYEDDCGSCDEGCMTPPRCMENCLQRYFKYCANVGREYKKRIWL